MARNKSSQGNASRKFSASLLISKSRKRHCDAALFCWCDGTNLVSKLSKDTGYQFQ